jgi:hypothetical protein
VTKSPRFEVVGGDPPASWSREEMWEAIRQVRRAYNQIELGQASGEFPSELLVAHMLEQLLAETEAR